MRAPEETESAQALHPPGGITEHRCDANHGCKILDVGTFGGSLHDVPDGFGCYSSSPDLIEPTDSAEDRPTVDAGRHGPLIDGAFRPDQTGTVRMCFPLPTRSAMTECSSRTWKSSVLRPTNSARRSPHPMSRAGVARSRLSRRPGDGDSRSSVLDSRPSTSFQSSPRDVSPLLHDGSLHQVRTQKPHPSTAPNPLVEALFSLWSVSMSSDGAILAASHAAIQYGR